MKERDVPVCPSRRVPGTSYNRQVVVAEAYTGRRWPSQGRGEEGTDAQERCDAGGEQQSRAEK